MAGSATGRRNGNSSVFALSTPPRPINEIGNISQLASSSVLPWNAFIDQRELTPELIWPRSITTFNDMRNDAQISGLYKGMTLPIRRYRWMIDPQDAKPELVEKLADDFGLPVVGDDPNQPRRRVRNRGRINFDDHLREAMLALLYGHYPFEQVGKIDPDGMFRYAKIAPRPPETIMQIKISGQDGDLMSIQQLGGMPAPEIAADRLVWYAWDMEGGQWVGRSMMRELYKHYVMKDMLLRVDTVKQERNGMGTPVVEAMPGASKPQMAELRKLAQAFKAGEAAGAAVPNGAKLTLQGVTGSIPDTMASIQYHDEQMARAWLMMFLQLGQTQTGSRALGESFIDYFALAQETIALWFAGVFNDHLIEDWVDWNYGEDEPAPCLTFVRNEDSNLAVTDLVSLIQVGAIVVDAELQQELRERYNLPDMVEGDAPQKVDTTAEPTVRITETPAGAPTTTPATEPVATSAPTPSNSAVTLPPRKLRRNPAAYELAASMNLSLYDSQYNSALDAIQAAWPEIKQAQIDELVTKIGKASTVAKLSKISATATGQSVLKDHMLAAALHGIDQAHAEARAQGVEAPAVDIDVVTATIESHADAVANLLTNSLSLSAQNKAVRTFEGNTKEQTASIVGDYLNALKDSYQNQILASATQQAVNAGRFAVFAAQGKSGTFYSSEILDNNTCSECASVDGTQYSTLDDGMSDYPAGGYISCEGQGNCRGTLVMIYDTEAQASM